MQRMAKRRGKAKSPRTQARRYWSKAVGQRSDALDLEAGVFTRSPAQIARSLKRSAERSTRRKSPPFRSAMSMLTLYENRAGRSLSAERRRVIRQAKDELRKLFKRVPGRAVRRRSGRNRESYLIASRRPV